MTTVATIHIMIQFLSLGQFDQLIICNPMLDDNYVSELFNISATYDIYITNWNCSGTEVMEVNKALIVLVNLTPNDVTYLLNQEGAQMSLTSNTWLIIVQDSKNSISDYFKNNNLRIGLNAKLFYAQEHDSFLYQALGVGTTTPEIKVYCSNL